MAKTQNAPVLLRHQLSYAGWPCSRGQLQCMQLGRRSRTSCCNRSAPLLELLLCYAVAPQLPKA